jgi:hypothetical protein
MFFFANWNLENVHIFDIEHTENYFKAHIHFYKIRDKLEMNPFLQSLQVVPDFSQNSFTHGPILDVEKQSETKHTDQNEAVI